MEAPFEPHAAPHASQATRLVELTATFPVVLAVGPSGSGRSHLLGIVSALLADRGRHVVRLRLSPQDASIPLAGLYRLLTALAEDSRWRERADRAEDELARLSADRDDPGRGEVADLLTEILRAGEPVALVVDDAHWIDKASLSLLLPLLAGADVVLVGAVRAGSEPADQPVETMMARRLVAVVPVRPLTRAQSAEVIHSALDATPSAGLVEMFNAQARGNPAALLALVRDHRLRDALLIVDRTAYVIPSTMSANALTSLAEPVRALGPRAWTVAKAMALLDPLGSAAANLIAENAGLTEAEVDAQLALLKRHRVVLRVGDGWRVRVPAVRDALRSALGPFERQTLAAAAVTAIWHGSASADDDKYLPDRLVEAGALIDQERSLKELLGAGGALLYSDAPNAERWLRAVTTRTTDDTMRAIGLIALAGAYLMQNKLHDAAEQAVLALTEFGRTLPPDLTQELQIIAVVGLVVAGRDRLVDIAEGTVSLIDGQPAQQVVTRAVALIFLGRWREGFEVLRDSASLWRSAGTFTVDIGNIFLSGAAVVRGDARAFFDFMADDQRWRARETPYFRYEQVRFETDMLLVLGERRRALALAEEAGMALEQLNAPGRFVVHWMGGQWDEALEAARRGVVTGLHLNRPPASVVMMYGASMLSTARGWLGPAREFAETGRGDHLEYLMDHAESRIARALGRHAEADRLLAAGLVKVREGGYVLRTEELWAEQAERHRSLGQHADAEGCLARIAQISQAQTTDQSTIVHLLSQATINGDQSAARRAVEMARDRAHPHELSMTLLRAARLGVAPSRNLHDAYEIFGGLDALLWRAECRRTMRALGVAVPGRATTTRENERLLAQLITDGLGNRQLAAALGTSEKSVEGWLTRLFRKTGLRSRVDLARAIITGSYR